MPFALDTIPELSEVSEAVNYLLANLSPGLLYNQTTGQITSDGKIVAYLYKYLAVKYADSRDGSVNFSDYPTDRLYFGLSNSDNGDESTNPADYIWYEATGGFGTTKYLWYQTTGGRQISFEVNVQRPDVGWVSTNTGSIDLDVISNSEITGQNFSPYFQPSSLQVTTVSGTPIFSNVIPQMFAVSGTNVAIFVDSQTDTDIQFENNTWRIGGSATTGNTDIVYTNITIGSPTNAGGWAAWPAPTAMSASPASIAVPTRYKDRFGNVYQGVLTTLDLVFVTQPTTGNKTQTAYLYQWSTGFPTNPGGTSTYTWATNTLSGYSGGAGWTTTLPVNPGTPFLKLYVAAKPVTDVTTATTTAVSWTSGYSIYDSTTANTPGFQTAQPTVYQWALSIPSISGTATYTWATGGFTAPTGWTTSITGSPSSGYTLYAATVTLIDSSTATVSVINWATSSIVASGYSGANGASSRVMYARIASNPVPVSGLVTVTGDNRPNGTQSSAVWGASFNITWYATDPTPSSTNSLYQADGVYDGTNTVWSTPYISSLKVGTLSAITVNTGALTVQNTLTMSTTGSILGGQTAYNTGTGFFLGYSGAAYKFSIGDSTTNMKWDGSAFTLTNAVLQGYSSGSNSNYFKIGSSSSGNLMYLQGQVAPIGAPLVFWYDTSASSLSFFQLDTNSKDSTTNAAVTLKSSASSGIGLIVTQSGSGGGAGKFFNTPSSKEFWVAPGSYSAYSPLNGGKIYIVDGNGPFTGFHDTLTPINATIEMGDIMVDTQLICKQSINSTLFAVEASSQPNQVGAIGVASFVGPIAEGTPGALWISTTVETDAGPVTTWSMQPGFDPEVMEATYKIVQINALGEGQLNVCGEGGDIQVGDLIVTSSIPGKGMKQSDNIVRSITVAKARESATFVNSTDVQMIACIYLGG
jgi:hypothetical protein